MMPVAVVTRWRIDQRVPLVVPVILFWPLLYTVLVSLWATSAIVRQRHSGIEKSLIAMRALLIIRGLRITVQDQSSFLSIGCY